MIKRILFSPIGHSDPVNADYDASWLHCCRYFQPDLTVVYLSAEIIPKERDEHQLSGILKKLEEKIHKEIRIETIERPELVNPHLFDSFYNDFEAILDDYHKKYPEAEIYANVSSGTPAMKGCLIHLYHMLPYKIRIIQVDGPHEDMKTKDGNRKNSNYRSIEEAWENDYDNDEAFAANRCRILEDEQQSLRLRLMQLKTIVRNHEYSAALALAKELEDSLPKESLTLLEAAVSRQQLDLYHTGLLLKGIEFDTGKKILQNYNDILFQGAEMFLTIKQDYERKDIGACLRKLTPVLFALIIHYLGTKGFELDKAADEDRRYLLRDRFKGHDEKAYNALEGRVFRNPGRPDSAILDSSTLLTILDYYVPGQTPEKKNILFLRELEKGVRVVAAHKPAKMTEKEFKKKAGCSFEDMIQKIQETFVLFDRSLFNKTYWDSYEEMDNLIIEKIKVEK